jgi:hypothetical protein
LTKLLFYLTLIALLSVCVNLAIDFSISRAGVTLFAFAVYLSWINSPFTGHQDILTTGLRDVDVNSMNDYTSYFSSYSCSKSSEFSEGGRHAPSTLPLVVGHGAGGEVDPIVINSFHRQEV